MILELNHVSIGLWWNQNRVVRVEILQDGFESTTLSVHDYCALHALMQHTCVYCIRAYVCLTLSTVLCQVVNEKLKCNEFRYNVNELQDVEFNYLSIITNQYFLEAREVEKVATSSKDVIFVRQ